MTTQYYEAVAEVPQDHCLKLRLPPEIPVGPVRVAVIFETHAEREHNDDTVKRLLAAMPDVGEDADFARPSDYGRDVPEWDS